MKKFSSPTLSLVIPFQGRADRLRQTLLSVAASECLPSELLLVDNGSTEGARLVVEHFLSTAGPLAERTHVLHEPVPGAPAARNCGLRQAKGEWIYFFDSDDLLSARFLSDVQAELMRHPDLDLLCAPTQMLLSGGRKRRRATAYSASPVDQIRSAMLSTQSMVLRREFLLDLGGWDNRYRIWNDWELGLRALLARPRLRWLRHRGYHLIIRHPDSISGASLSDRAERVVESQTMAFELVRPYARPRRAMLGRTAIVAAQLQRAGAADGARELRRLLRRECRTRAGLWRLYALYMYTLLGGRGAWRLA